MLWLADCSVLRESKNFDHIGYILSSFGIFTFLFLEIWLFLQPIKFNSSTDFGVLNENVFKKVNYVLLHRLFLYLLVLHTYVHGALTAWC